MISDSLDDGVAAHGTDLFATCDLATQFDLCTSAEALSKVAKRWSKAAMRKWYVLYIVYGMYNCTSV